MRDRVAESIEEREVRLQQMSTYQGERLATETVKEREARLQQMSIYQRERLATETVKERPGCSRGGILKWRDWLPRMQKRGRLGNNMTERAIGSNECREHLDSCTSHFFNSVLYKPRSSMHMLFITVLPLIDTVDVYVYTYFICFIFLEHTQIQCIHALHTGMVGTN